MLIMNNMDTHFERADSCEERGKLLSQTQKNKGGEKSGTTMQAQDEGEIRDFSLLLRGEDTQTTYPLSNDEDAGTKEDVEPSIAGMEEEKTEEEDGKPAEAADVKNTTDLLFLNQILSSRLTQTSAQQAGTGGGANDGRIHEMGAFLPEGMADHGGNIKKNRVEEKERGAINADRRDTDTIGQRNNSQRLVQKNALKMAEGMNIQEKTGFDGKGNPPSTPVNFDKIAVGDKITLKTARADANSPVSPINGVEILQSKKTGALTFLHLKLDPMHLGQVEARIRTSREGLHIELRSERQNTARTLAQDQLLLTQILEKSGFDRQSQIHVHVTEHGEQMMQNISGNSQQFQDTRQNNASSSQFAAGNGTNSSQDEGRHASSERKQREENLSRATQQDISLERLHRAHRDSHRLFV